MFYNDFKNKALNEHKKAEDAYERIFKGLTSNLVTLL